MQWYNTMDAKISAMMLAWREVKSFSSSPLLSSPLLLFSPLLSSPLPSPSLRSCSPLGIDSQLSTDCSCHAWPSYPASRFCQVDVESESSLKFLIVHPPHCPLSTSLKQSSENGRELLIIARLTFSFCPCMVVVIILSFRSSG